MMTDTYQVDSVKLKKCVTGLFHNAGVPADEAQTIADCLVEADLCGIDSHGITRIGGYVKKMEEGGFAKAASLELLSERINSGIPVSAVVFEDLKRTCEKYGAHFDIERHA